MIVPPSGARVYLAMTPCDMRKGLDGLAAQVQSVLKADPFSGALFDRHAPPRLIRRA